MNITVIIIEIVLMLLIFGFLVFGLLLINPVTFVSDYPKEIQEVYYKSQNKMEKREKFTIAMIIKKVVFLVIMLFVFAWMLHIAGAKTFIEGLLLSYLYFILWFMWDTFFLDWVLFANIKRIRLPGTEHMDKEYHQKWFHVKVCIPMIPVFLIGGVLVSLVMILIW